MISSHHPYCCCAIMKNLCHNNEWYIVMVMMIDRLIDNFIFKQECPISYVELVCLGVLRQYNEQVVYR